MRQPSDVSIPAPGAGQHRSGLLWASAPLVAGFGAWVLFDALPGINWFLWTGAAVTGLLLLSRSRPATPSAWFMTGAPVVIAGGAAVTASEGLSVLICISIIVLLALQMLLSAGLGIRSITAWFAAIAAPVALRLAALQTLRQCVESTRLIRSSRARAWVRGLAITLPVLIAFALLLASADPVFAGWRDAVGSLVADWEFVPRVVFFLALLVIVLGAYSYASLERPSSPALEKKAAQLWLGSTERVILLAGIAGLFWLFLVVQLGYLFGNLPQVPASGVTFAEYARRGFGELSIVASASALLIVVSEQFGNDDDRGRTLQWLTFAVIAAVLLLLGSAFHRVWLYEAAYGFTTARLYAQVYMCGVAAGLGLITLEVARDFDAGRLFRRAAAAAMVLFIALVYWNHEAWIAGRNMERYATTGKLDVAYLTRELSPDALPTIAERLPSLPEPVRAEIHHAVQERYTSGHQDQPRAWFEWNLARSRARQILNTSFASP